MNQRSRFLPRPSCRLAWLLIASLASSPCAAEKLQAGCGKLVVDVAAGNQTFVTGRVGAGLESKVHQLRTCPVTFERNYQLGLYYANLGRQEDSIPFLKQVASENPETEPKRLALLFWMYYSTYKQQQERTAVVVAARSSFPASPYTRMIVGVQECIEGRCASALPDLQYADARLHEVRALPFLAFGYAAQEEFDKAASALDLMQRVAGDRIMNDRVVYVSVITYLNVGRGAEAEQIYRKFLKEFPASAELPFMRRSRAALTQVGQMSAN